ncbi:hypothetical protein HSB1_41590 [Halogranum salarium B-1]|uniref:Uncharacterized protein n=1 Tax=Halogranum salarium B-1 TaxID=1210908 RepID=J3JDG6_9EURY|nr:hypothetical protein HSB1_41590 [Halogranum salarium B-1]
MSRRAITTRPFPNPSPKIAFVSEGHPRSLEIVSQLPITDVINETPVVDSAFSSTGRVVSIETGKVQQPNSVATSAAEKVREETDDEGWS